MLSRIDQFCILVADANTTRKQILEFVSDDKNENIDINDTNYKDNSRPVEFAAQSGHVDNLKLLIEEMHADVSINAGNANYNLLQWAHDPESSPDVRIYLGDLQKKIWLAFNDDTSDLHIYAMKGRWTQVEAILTQEPDSICEMSAGRFSPLYWANLAKQTEMREKLQKKLHEFKIRHADDEEKMLEYHAGMIFANIESHESYAELNKFLTLGKKLSENSPEWKNRFIFWLRLIGNSIDHINRKIINRVDKELQDTKEEIELLKQLDADQVFQKSIALLLQGVKAISTLKGN